jgi:hypothetical protein
MKVTPTSITLDFRDQRLTAKERAVIGELAGRAFRADPRAFSFPWTSCEKVKVTKHDPEGRILEFTKTPAVNITIGPFTVLFEGLEGRELAVMTALAQRMASWPECKITHGA